MATRTYDFVSGIESATAPTATDPSADADLMNKGYADDTYSKRSSWYDKQATNAAIRGIAVADRSNGQVVFNYGTDKFYKFDAASSDADDDDTVLQPDVGTGRWLAVTSGGGGGGGSGETLVQNLDVSVSASILSGENLAIRDAVCLELHNGSGSDVYRVFKCDEDLNTRRSFIGFSTAAVSGTTGSYKYTISAAYVSGNVVPIVINGRSYQTTYASSSDATLQALATLIATDQDVTSAVVTVIGGNQTGTDDREIVITPKGHLALDITGTTITGGASQPTVSITNPTPPVGAAVDIHQFGPLAGFSGLTPGGNYYLSGTAGSITLNPSAAFPIYVGRALSASAIFVDPMQISRIWGSSKVAVRSHGYTGDIASTAVDDVELFNFTSWSSGTASGFGARGRCHGSTLNYNSEHAVIDGKNTGDSAGSLHATFNKAAWTSRTAPGTARTCRSVANFAGLLYINGGTPTEAGSAVANSDAWNGSAWSAKNSITNARINQGTFLVNGLMNMLGGFDTGSAPTVHHQTKNTSDSVSSETSVPVGTSGNSGANQSSTLGVFRTSASGGGDANQAYAWNGSVWSAAISTNRSMYAQRATTSVYAENKNLYFENGGRLNGTSTTYNSSETYNGLAFSTSTASSNARNSASGSYT